MSDNKFVLRDQNDDLTICLSNNPKGTDLVLFVFRGDKFERTRIITEHNFVYYNVLPIEHLMMGTFNIARRSCFDTLDEMVPHDAKFSPRFSYYIVTYAEFTKLTPQEFQIFLSENRGYSVNEIMYQVEIRRKELLPELFG